MSSLDPGPVKEDREIVTGIRNKNKDANQWLVDQYSTRLLRFVRFEFPSLSRNDAEEVVFDSFRAVIAKIGKFDHANSDERGFRNWVYTITANLARDRIKSLTAQPETLLYLDDVRGVANPSIPDEGPSERTPILLAVQRVLDAMDPKKRRDLYLADAHGLSREEIAEFYQEKSGTIGTRLSRARDEFYSLILQQPEFADWAQEMPAKRPRIK